MKTFIAIPCLDQMETAFVQSLTNLQPVGSISFNYSESSLVYDSREKLMGQAIASRADYILWLDSDVVFPSTLLIDMMTDMENRDFISALYFKRRYPFEPCIYETIRLGLPEQSISKVYRKYPEEEIFEIDACGFGAVLMKTEICETILKRDGAGFSPIPGYGEDISFCIRAKRAGYKLWCDSRLTLGHCARQIITADTYMKVKERCFDIGSAQ